MISTKLASIGLAASLAATLPAVPAQAAGAPRTFLSAAGSDANNCTNVATPCRHMAAAFAATAPDGEIYVLDPANYGSLTITGPVSIEGHGWASIAPTSGNPAITINAPGATDKINIVGVVLDGTALNGTTGIQFNSGGSLTVRDSVIRNFGGDGINFEPVAASQLFVSNTLVSENALVGIQVGSLSTGTGTSFGVIDHVAMEHNAGNGLTIQSTATQTINLTVNDSMIANNVSNAIVINTNSVGGAINVMVRNCTIVNNVGDALHANGTSATLRVTRSTITANGTGWFDGSSAVVLSYGDNNIDGNTSVNTEPPNPLTYH